MPGPWEEFKKQDGPWSEYGATPAAPPEKPKATGVFRKAGDVGLSIAKGVIGVPEAAVGLADLVSGGAAGKAVEGLGVRFKDAKQVLTDLQSDDLKGKQQQFQQADGVVDKLGVALSNPSLIANAVGESIPLMGAGGVAARGILGIGARGVSSAAGGVGPAAPGILARTIGAPAAATAAGAIGEGLAGAGSAAEQIRQETPTGDLTGTQSALAAGSGVATGLIGAAGGALARRMGIADPDAMIAAGTRNVVAPATARGAIRRTAEGAVAESLFEEVPQSLSEQAFQNAALGRPLTEGMADAGVMGGLAGAAMGGVAGAMARPAVAPAPTAPPAGPLTRAAMLALPAPVVHVDGAGRAKMDGVPSGGFDTGQQEGTVGRTNTPLTSTARDLVPSNTINVDGQGNASPPPQPPAGSPPRQPGEPGPRETGAMGQGRGSEGADFPVQGEIPPIRARGPLATSAGMAPQQPAIEGPRALAGPDTITDNGQPFRSGVLAQRAARQAGLGFRPVAVEGGWVVRRDNSQAEDAQIKEPTNAAQPRLQAPAATAAAPDAQPAGDRPGPGPVPEVRGPAGGQTVQPARPVDANTPPAPVDSSPAPASQAQPDAPGSVRTGRADAVQPGAAPAAAVEPTGQQPAPASAETGRYGRDGVDLSAGGKPFKDRQSAAKFQAENMKQGRVVKAPGGKGFAVRDPTDAELMARTKAGNRLQATHRARSIEKNPLLAWMADKGLGAALKADLSPDANQNVPGYGNVFRDGGLEIDLLAQRAVEDGFLPPGGEGRTRELADLMARAIAGERIIPQYAEGAVEAEVERRQQEEEPPALTDEEIDAAIERAAIQAADLPQDVLDDLDVELEASNNTSTEDAMRAMGFTEQEISDAVANESRSAQEGSQGSGGRDEPAAQAPPRSAGPGEGNGAGAPQDLLGEAPNASQQAAARLRAEREAQQRRQQQAAPSPDDFMMSGSDRAADVGDAAGQGDLLATSPVAESQAPAIPPVSSREGQMRLANRGSRIAALKLMNEQLRKIAPAEAWADSNIEDATDLDALQDQISGALVAAQSGPAAVNPLRAELEAMSGAELRGIMERLNLAGTRMTQDERVEALLAEDEAEVRAAMQAPDQAAKAAAAATRTRPRDTITFPNPVTGPSGQQLVAYTWQWKPMEMVDKRGEDRTVRISNWQEAATNPETGRDVVHQFTVRAPGGDEQTVSAESAMKLLGYVDAGTAKAPTSVMSAAKTLAKWRMAQAETKALLDRFDQDDAEVKALALPAMPTEKDEKGWWNMGDASVRQIEAGPLTEERKRALIGAWRDNRMQERGWKTSGDLLAGKAREIEDALKRAERKLKEATSAAAAAAPAPAEKPATKIEDFGQKLEGARKDYAATLKDAEAVDIAAEPLSKSWPEPDYDKLLAGGADPYVVAFVHAARDEVPTKPQKGWKLKGWVQSVETLRGASKKLLAGEISKDRVQTLLNDDAFGAVRRAVGSRAELYELVGHAKSLKGVTFAENHYTLYKGQNNVRKWVVEQKAKATAFSNWPRELAVADTKAEMLEQFKAKFSAESLDGDKAKAATKGQFIIYRKRNQEGAFIGKKIGREYIDLKKLPDVAAARAYLESNTADLSAALERYKDTPFERNPENRPRVGGDHRNGAAVTPEVFADTFGFRGVQFGNYVEQNRRQSDLNQTFDALMDMAAVLGVPPRALSLNGRLGLAFGARGKGGKNAPAAHYEPDTVVINLTKGNGPGSLGHEWWHAVDNYFGKEFGEGGFATDGARVDRLRAEMQAAFKAVRNATQVPTLRKRAAELDKRRTKPYWNTPLELSARAFESYLIAKLNDQGAANDYLANVVDEKVWNLSEEARATFFGGEAVETYPYPGQAELPAVRAAFDEFFKVVETREDDAGNVAMFSRAQFRRGDTTGHELRVTEIQKAVSRLSADWLRRPDIYVIDSMDDAPGPIREEWLQQNSQGAAGSIEGFHYRGQVYLVADALVDEADVRRVLFHEALGHWGLRNVFGAQLNPILDQIATMRQALGKAKATQYGLAWTIEQARDMIRRERIAAMDAPDSPRLDLTGAEFEKAAQARLQMDRRDAAEEVLAEMAQTRPELGWVQRTISAIRRWLRAHGVSLGLSDNDIIADYILPARGWVERGRAAAPSIMRGPAMAARSNAGRDPFYSALAAEVDKIGAKAMPGMGWQSALNGLVNKGAVKADEVEWSGIREWLDMQQGKVTKQQVLEYLDGNGVRVQEVTKGKDYSDLAEWWGDEGGANEETPFSDLTPAQQAEARERYDDEVGAYKEDAAKYDQYQLPGGTNYREVLLTLPVGTKPAWVDRAGNVRSWIDTEPSAEVTRAMEASGLRRQDMPLTDAAGVYKSSHWDTPNVLAHIRLNDRTDADGKRVLFVEELQSDYAQDARKQGIKTGKEASNFSTFAERRGIPQAEWQRMWDNQDKLTGKDAVLWAEWQAELKRGANGVTAAPFIDSTDKWLTLALKRVMVMAAQEGYDRVAFVNGEQSADRYSLSKSVDSINWQDLSSELRTVQIDMQGSAYGGDIGLKVNKSGVVEMVTSGPTDLKGKNLEDVIGKAAAEKIMAEPKGNLSGDGLKIGGEGMIAFYDKIVPAAVNKLLGKVGGGKIADGMVARESAYPREFPSEAAATEWAEANLGDHEFTVRGHRESDGTFIVFDEFTHKEVKGLVGRPQPGFDITPDMREKVAGGMPMFSRQIDQTETPAFRAWFKDSKVVDAEGKPLVVYHGTALDLVGNAFNASMAKSEGGAFYFSHSPLMKNPASNANEYAAGRAGDSPNVVPVYLSMKNPLVTGFTEPMPEGDKEIAAWLGRMERFNRSIDWTKERYYKQAIRDALSAGHDGVIIRNVEDVPNDAGRRFTNETDVYIAFRPEQIKSAIGNRGTFDPGNPDIMFSRSTIAGATTRQYSPEQQRAMRNVGFEVDQPTYMERAQALWKDAGKKLAQGIADQFAPIKDLDAKAYSLLRLSKGASGAFETFLHGGKLKLSDGVYDFDEAARGGVLDSLLIPLQGEHHDFFRWVAANRAERLAREGRENLFTPQDIADLKTLADGQLAFDFTLANGPRAGQTTRSRAEAYRDSLATFNTFNKNVLDLAEQSGLIDGESRHLWEHEFYVPFYRVADEDGGIRGANIKTGVIRQEAFKKLKGGGQALNMDLLDNTLLNWAHLLDAAAKNRGAKATLEAAQRMGVAIEANETVARQIGTAMGNKQGVVWFMDDGMKRYFVVDDPYVLAALTSLEYAGMRNPVMDAMGAFKHALTVGVTSSPFFKVRNLIRDSVQVIGTSGIGVNPAANVAQGWKLTDPKSDAYFRLLAGGGTIHFGTMMEGNEAKRVQALVESGVDSATILNSQNKVKAFYRKYIEPGITAYNELGNRGEAVNRAALYQQLRAQGKDHAEASLQARDLMDFSMQGTFTSIRFLTQVVPFFNARIQGMYKLGRAAKEDPARFSAVLGATALFSIALLAAYGDDDDWKKREEWDRNNYWWFKFGDTAFRIPKPFEIGAIGTLAERSWELAFDEEMTGTRFRKQVQTLLADNLSMNPIPQLIKPVVDVYANKDSFTGRPIETMDMERLRADYRFTDRTSMFARGVSTTMNAATGLLGAEALSPVQVDHMLRGYFGWLGAFIVGAGDTIARPATDQPSHPTPDYWKTVTGGMASDLRDAPSRYVSQMYEQAKEIEKAYGTWKMLLREGKIDEAREFREDNAELLNQHKQVERVKKAESALNQRARMIERSNMDPDRKRELLRQINEQKDRTARLAS